MVPKISTYVSKLGSCIPCINLPAGVSCRPNAPCSGTHCYAQHGRFMFPKVRKSHMNNYQAYINNPDLYFEYIDDFLKHSLYVFFRYHSSGDIIDDGYFKRMSDVAKNNSNIKFLCFTKKYEIVNDFMKSSEIPPNLSVVFSNWAEFKCDNPYNLPEAYVRFKDKNINSCVPASAKECSRYCGSCVKTNDSCWDLKRGESVVFNQH